MNSEFANPSEEKLYYYQGKTFPANPKTISILNYALALNRSSERYVLVGDLPKEKPNGK